MLTLPVSHRGKIGGEVWIIEQSISKRGFGAKVARVKDIASRAFDEEPGVGNKSV